MGETVAPTTTPVQLGDGLEVSPIGVGTMGLSPGVYGDVTDDDALRLIGAAIDRGATFLDTADAYGRGEGERLVARAVAGRRDEVTLATKFGYVGPDQGRRVDVGYRMKLFVDASPAHAAAAIDASLSRLGVDHVDLWYLHFPDPEVPIEETVGAMAEQVRIGKVRHLGLSNVTAEQLRRAHSVHRIAALQCEYSLWHRAAERDLIRACRNTGAGIVAWGPLGSGFLTDSGFLGGHLTEVPTNDFRSRNDRFNPNNLGRNAQRYAALTPIAKSLGCTTAQLALAWLIRRGAVPIPGTRSLDHLTENLGATTIAIPDDVADAIDAQFGPGAAVGAAFHEPS
ncbi:aldo/keto reductase [Mycobacterium sp. OAE908]|uniref:aldo/keto reductase n=1 Tax=Mycobacterium sp. OAE908 TaxID=2817899 RepID=UPI001AEA54D9